MNKRRTISKRPSKKWTSRIVSVKIRRAWFQKIGMTSRNKSMVFRRRSSWLIRQRTKFSGNVTKLSQTGSSSTHSNARQQSQPFKTTCNFYRLHRLTVCHSQRRTKGNKLKRWRMKRRHCKTEFQSFKGKSQTGPQKRLTMKGKRPSLMGSRAIGTWKVESLTLWTRPGLMSKLLLSWLSIMLKRHMIQRKSNLTLRLVNLQAYFLTSRAQNSHLRVKRRVTLPHLYKQSKMPKMPRYRQLSMQRMPMIKKFRPCKTFLIQPRVIMIMKSPN